MKSFTDYLNEKMDPRDHAVERDGKFVVVDKDGKTVKSFEDKAAAEKYAVANHDKLMEGCGCDGTNEDFEIKKAGKIGAAISNRKDLPASEKNVARRSLQRKVARAQRKTGEHNVNADAGRRYRVGTKRPVDPKDPKHAGLRRNATISSYGTNEEVEQVDELSDKTLKSYIKKAQKDNTDRVTRMADKPSHMSADKDEMRKLRKRQRGVVGAKTQIDMRRIAGKNYRKRMGEDVQEACWDSHVQQGTKMKKGKMVPNCVPKTESVEQVDEMKYLGKDKKFGRKFYEKDGQLHVVVNDGRPQNLGSVEVKGNAKMIKKLVKEESIDEAVFSKSQLDQIRAQYSKIKTVDPSQPTYGKLTAFLDKLDDAKLKQLSTAKIKFVSGLALNRVTKRKMK